MGQLDVDDVPGFRVEILTPGRVDDSSGLFHQAVVALVAPAREALCIVALGMQVTLKKAVRIETITVATDVAMKVPLFQRLTQRDLVQGSESHLETDAIPLLLDDLRTFAI